MSRIREQTKRAFATFPDRESLTVLLATGVSRDHAAAVLGVDLAAPTELGAQDSLETAWGLREIPGGLLAVEVFGYGDPTNSALRALSERGQLAAVVRNNVQAHVRFGCARNGELLFDDDEYRYHVADPGSVPEDLRPLMREADSENLLLVGLAMVERFTGLDFEPGHVISIFDSTFYVAPNGVYRSRE